VSVIEEEGREEACVQSPGLLRLARDYGLAEERPRVPEGIFTASEETQRGFLQALFSADGHVSGTREEGLSVRLTSVSEELLKGVQRLLLNFGIASVIRNSRPAYHELIISGDNLKRFADEIGFLSEGKQRALEEKLAGCNGEADRETFLATFRELVPEGEEEVFDLTEPLTHSFVANGIVVHNCGEQPLLPFESCVAKGSRITTDRGLEKIEDLYSRQQKGEEIYVAAQQGKEIAFYPATVVYVGRRPVVKVTLSNGQSIRVTPDHRFLTPEGFKEARELEPGKDKVIIQGKMSGAIRFSENDHKLLYQMLGWFSGDGWFTDKRTFGLTFGPDDQEAFQTLVPIWREFTETHTRTQVQRNFVRCVSTQKQSAREKFLAFGFKPGLGPQKRVPDSLFTAPKSLQIAYLQGLFSADGSLHNSKPQIQLSSASKELLRDVQLLLLNLGIYSRITYYPVKPRGRAQGALYIYGKSFRRFVKLIGFPLSKTKQEKAQKKLSSNSRWYNPKKAVTVASIEADGEDEVYDIYEPTTHTFIAEGMVVHNCNLGSINLCKMVTEDGRIDWEKLERTVKLAVRFLDDVITVNRFPLPQIKAATLRTRKIGLGVMGFADMLIKLGIPYDSEEALRVAEQIMEAIAYWSKEASVELAKERGPFPAYEGSIYTEGRFPFSGPCEESGWAYAPRFNWKKLAESIRKHGIRNATTTTIAPTGSISIIANCSSGIEPLFALSYRKRMLGDVEAFVVDPVFEAFLREDPAFPQGLKEEILKLGQIPPDAPVPERYKRLFVTAFQIPPERHIQIQAAFQRYTDNAVSKTINFPASAPPEKVAEAFLLAYELGCKGITVYRSGSREGQVITCGLSQLC